MNELRPGDVVPMDSFTAVYGDRRKGKGDFSAFSYRKLSGGRQYAFLFLGAGSPEAPLDAEAVLNTLGWRRST